LQNCENTLIHYGIKGQKWGVRRFQEENGSYTAAGKERYGRGGKDGKPLTFGARVKKSASSATKAVIGKIGDKIEEKRKENPKNLSDEELQERINRMNKEAQYKRLQNELNQKPNQNNQNKGGEKGGKKQKHPYLALALLTPVATAIGLGTSAIAKEHVSNFLNKRADTKVFTAIEYARQNGGTLRAQLLREAGERAVRTADKLSDTIYK